MWLSHGMHVCHFRVRGSLSVCHTSLPLQALYLCGLMLLQEDASQSHSFSECATEPLGQEGRSLLQSLEALAASQRADEHRPLLMWVIQQLQVIQKQQMGTPVDGEGWRRGEGRGGGGRE